jgi:hypothetical protein
VTGASHRNWASYGHHVELPADLPSGSELAGPIRNVRWFLVSCVAPSAPFDPGEDQGRGLPRGAHNRPHGSRQPSITVV